MYDHYRQIVENAPDAILVVSDGKLLCANAAAAALVGLPDAASLLHRNVLDFTPKESHGQILRLIGRLDCEADAATAPIETKVRHVDGTTRDVEVRACPSTYDDVRCAIVFVRDVTSRKRAERELRASEERHRQVVDSMNEALVVYDPDANIAFVNRQFCALFECNPEDVVGRAAVDVYAPETLKLVHNGLERRRRGLQERYEGTLTARKGKTVVAQISAAPLVHDGKFAGSLALITDITDRKLAQDKLRKSEQRYQEIADSSPNFILSFDCEDRYTAANRMVCQSLGLPADALIGRTLEEAGVPPDVAREWREQNALTRSTQQTITRETVVVFRRTSPRVLRRTTSPIYGEGGAVAGVSTLSIDITEQKRSEEKNQKLLRAIEAIDEVMFTTDPSGVITYVNPAFERIYGYSSAEAVGKTPRIVKSDETPPEVYERFWRDLAMGKTVSTEFVNRCKDGHLVTMAASVSPIYGEDGRLTGFTAVQRDLTAERHAQEQRRQLEQQLSHSAKMQSLGTLSGGIAHDFNNILSVIVTQTAIAELSKNNPERMDEAFTTIKRAVQRGGGLARQILTFARKTDVHFRNVDLNRIVNEISSMVREMFPRNIAIEVQCADALPPVRADSDQLHQALLNLCLNARDAMSGGGTLRLQTRAADDSVCVAVSDTGEGITSDKLTRIFEPFFTTKQVGKGSGLGLAVVYGIMNAHEGWIDVTSEPSRGSMFELFFPACAAGDDEDGTPQSETAPGEGDRLLIIEDEIEIAEGLSMQLDGFGYSITMAHNADELRRTLASHSFDLILTDLGIPGITSRELVRMLRAGAPDVPVIPMTGYVDPDLHKDVVACGTEAILEKPFTLDQLLRRLAAVTKADAARQLT